MAFVGLGVMGFPMAGHLAAKGHEVTVFNRTAAKAEAWSRAASAARWPPRPREAAEAAEIVFACVGNDDDLRSVVLGAGGHPGRPGAGRDRRRPHHGLGRASRASSPRPPGSTARSFIDAPVSGGQAGAENGTLTIMCGGDDGGRSRAPSRCCAPMAGR